MIASSSNISASTARFADDSIQQGSQYLRYPDRGTSTARYIIIRGVLVGLEKEASKSELHGSSTSSVLFDACLQNNQAIIKSQMLVAEAKSVLQVLAMIDAVT